MSEMKKNTQQVVEMARFLNVYLTVEQISAVEKMLGMGVTPVNLVRLIQNLGGPNAQSSPSNRENALH